MNKKEPISDIPPISNFEVCSHDPYSEKGFEEIPPPGGDHRMV